MKASSTDAGEIRGVEENRKPVDFVKDEGMKNPTY